jgi:hypothetical protein
MKTNWVRILALAAIAAGAGFAQPPDSAQALAQSPAGVPIVGVWNVAVKVVNCSSGDLIRTVQSVQMYQQDGAFSETTSIGARGSSIGYWYRKDGQTYGASYFFFRYNPDESFHSFAKAANTITLSPDGNQFTVTATIQDYDANNNLLSTGCVTQVGTRL